MSCSTSTRVTLSYKHGSENVSGKILEKKGRNKEKIKKKRKTKGHRLLAKVKLCSGQLKSVFSM